MKRAAALPCLIITGCAAYYGERPACPIEEMTDVAVLPVLGAPDAVTINAAAIVIIFLVLVLFARRLRRA